MGNSIIPTEDAECVLLAEFLDLLKRTKKIKQYTHIPNETYTKYWSQKRKNKALGVMSGVPDYLIITNKDSLFIEMKRTKGGRISPTQQEWINDLNSVGIKAVVCNGYNEAEKFLTEELSTTRTEQRLRL